MTITYGDLTFDDTTYGIDSLDDGLKKRKYTEPIRGRDGEERLDDSDIEGRVFRINGFIHATDAAGYETAKDELKEVLSLKAEQKLVLNSGRHFWAECTDYSIPETPRDPFGSNFTAVLFASDPYEEHDTETVVVATPTGWDRISAGQNGNAVVYPTIRITGSVVNPTIITGDALLQAKFEGALSASRTQNFAHSGSATYAEGRWGDIKGAVVVTAAETLTLAMAGNVEQSKGSISFNWYHNDNSTARELLSLNADFKLKLSNERKLSFYNDSAESEWDYALSNETWYHILLTWDVDQDERHLYVNGVERSGSTYGEPALSGNMTLMPDGRVCDFRVYSQALTASEAAQLYSETSEDYADDYASIQYTGTIDADETLVINCKDRTVKLNGTAVLADLTTVGDDFPKYPSVHRDLLYTQASGAPTIRVSFKDLYL
jgi:hypothetical protein